MTDSSRLKSTIYVAGLDNAVNDKILADVFLPFGEILEVTIPKSELPSSTDPHRGFGYVEFEILGDAKEAIDNMDQSELFGRVIKVAAAKPQKDSNEGLGSKTAVWESEGYLAKHAVSEEDRIATGPGREELEAIPEDPMQGLEGLDVAGPQPV
ncbi:hypothetical protein HO173_010595 [Letharia columbiana]|uniref:RRM domain-containing protein n=1 Tax=Letharia columbiana TaxID=112416 RepID=A0A8H6FMJ2_9LECA|nr:uncharacterized protein HO173_010595 [Letharia columbiana]KAF6231263.1 hypothetical protein HO173_010595 [Letharia columbiana]